MPRVPQYQPQVEERPLPVPDAGSPPPPAAYGAIAAAHIGKIAGEIYAEERERANVALINTKTSELNKFELELESSKEPEQVGEQMLPKGWRYRVGKDGLDIDDVYGARYHEFVQQQIASIPDEQARIAYQRLAEAREFSARRQMADHVGRQFEAVQTEALETTVATAAELAEANPSDFQKVEEAAGVAAQSIAAFGAAHGWSPERIAERQHEAAEHIYGSGLIAFPAKDTAGQRLYLERYGALIDARTKAQVEKGISAVERETEEREFVNMVWKEAKGDLGRAIELVEELGKDKDGDFRDDADQRVRLRYNTEQAAKSAREDEARSRLYSAFVEANWDMDAVPDALIREVGSASPGIVRELLSWTTAVEKSVDISWNDVTPQTFRAWSEYQMLPPYERIKIDPLVVFGGRLPWDEVRKLTRERADEQQNFTKQMTKGADDLHKAFVTGINGRIKSTKLSGKVKDMYIGTAMEELKKLQAAKPPGEFLSKEEIDEVLDGLLVRGQWHQWYYWNPERRALQIPIEKSEGWRADSGQPFYPWFPGQAAAINPNRALEELPEELEGIPVEDIVSIREAAARRGLPSISPADIRKAWELRQQLGPTP